MEPRAPRELVVLPPDLDREHGPRQVGAAAALHPAPDGLGKRLYRPQNWTVAGHPKEFEAAKKKAAAASGGGARREDDEEPEDRGRGTAEAFLPILRHTTSRALLRGLNKLEARARKAKTEDLGAWLPELHADQVAFLETELAPVVEGLSAAGVVVRAAALRPLLERVARELVTDRSKAEERSTHLAAELWQAMTQGGGTHAPLV